MGTAISPKEFSEKLTGYAMSKHDEIYKLVGNQQKAEKFSADLALMSLNVGLVKCTPISVFTTALKIAQIGLSIVQERKQAYLVPYKNKGIYEAQLQISYIGWQILAKRAGYDVDCELVYECDEFEYVVDENGKNFKFKANLAERETDSRKWIEDNLVGAMVWSRDKHGVKKEFVSAKKLKQLQGNSPAIKFKKFSAWDDWTEEMFKAKAIKYVSSKLPTDNEALMIAVNADNEVEKSISDSNKAPAQDINLNDLMSSSSSDDVIDGEVEEVTENDS